MTDPWAQDDPPPEPPAHNRRRTVAIAVSVGAALAILGSVGLFIGASVADRDTPATSTSAKPLTITTRDVGPPMDERQACVALVPVLSDAVDVIEVAVQTQDAMAVHEHKAKLDAATADLKLYVRRIPEHMRPDVRVILDALGQVENLRSGNSYSIKSSSWAAGVAIGTRCQRYAS